MTSTEHIRFIVGIIGNVISFFLFASPVPTFRRIVKKKSTEEFQPYPYLASCINCMFWIFYGQPFIHPDSLLVITINGIGLTLELAYLLIFFIFTKKTKFRVQIVAALIIELIILGITAAPTLLSLHTYKSRSMVVGGICVFFGVIMYASPLAVMKKVITTKSVEFMPFWLSVASFLNGLVWSTYALLKFDLYILIGNGLGAMFGLAQLILYTIYSIHGKKPEKHEQEVKPSEVQLPSV